ncbi:MAG: rhomboid family intramembrane serine protease [Caulobacter sp.]
MKRLWPTMVLAGLLAAIALAQLAVEMSQGRDWLLIYGAASSLALAHGLWWTPLTSMFLHGGLLHVAMNVSGMVALGPAVHYRWGVGVSGAVKYLIFFILTGLAGSAVFLLLNPAGQVPMVGASGAICGLWGAAARISPYSDRLFPILSGPVWRQARAFLLMNLILVALFFVPSLLVGGGLGGIAWEAHLGGFLAGLLLIAAPPFRPPPAPSGPWTDPV